MQKQLIPISDLRCPRLFPSTHDEATSTSRAITPSFVDLSQDPYDAIDDVEEEGRQCKIASCGTTVVGIRYYSGKAHAGGTCVIELN